MRHYTEEVPETLAGERIDRVISLITDLSRREATELIAAGAVTIDGRVPVKASERLVVGSVVTAEVPDRHVGIDADASVVVPVVHIDDEVIVVDKPAGMVVHPGAGVRAGTMIQGLLHQFPDLAPVGDDPLRPGVVHRLDKGTSGLLMVARTAASFRHLVAQLAARTVVRRYEAVVWGDLASAEGVVDAPLGRSPRDATRHAVVADGRPARTHYRVVERFDDPVLSRLDCRLETGRTHQIRVHLEAIDHPVLGDDRYGRGRSSLGLTRPFLHAAVLGFEHPTSGEHLEFKSELPPDLAKFLEDARSSS